MVVVVVVVRSNVVVKVDWVVVWNIAVAVAVVVVVVLGRMIVVFWSAFVVVELRVVEAKFDVVWTVVGGTKKVTLGVK